MVVVHLADALLALAVVVADALLLLAAVLLGVLAGVIPVPAEAPKRYGSSWNKRRRKRALFPRTFRTLLSRWRVSGANSNGASELRS